ncbi:2-iminobutanoate/2-iminopropanoate deaminase rida [Holotrichia oblita]|nr:2-iminobutanoate/2-iminopropanoate deaminase rida [Holotrichia oblita]
MKIIATQNAPAAVGPYSQGIAVDNFVFLSGQIPLDPQSNQLVAGDVAAQTEQVIKNITAVLESENLKLHNVIKTTCYLIDMKDFAKFNEVYGKYFSHKPARSTVAVKELPKGAIVEIEVIALR